MYQLAMLYGINETRAYCSTIVVSLFDDFFFLPFFFFFTTFAFNFYASLIPQLVFTWFSIFFSPIIIAIIASVDT